MANEKRLIDANAFLDEALKRYTERERGRYLLYTACEVKQNLADMICEAPTVDAVEVVRCKDCKHYGWESEPCHGRTQRFCRLHKGLVVVDRETFCSYGERKDNA